MRTARFVILVALAVSGCSRPASDAPEEPPTDAKAPSSPTAKSHATPPLVSQVPAVDACALLTGDEIASIHGGALERTTPSTRTEAGIPIAQCYFHLPTAADSLSLIVYKKPTHEVAKTPAALWTEMFHTEREPKTGRDGKPKAQPTPQKLEGVGDEAFWGGGQFGGTLHVLKGEDVFQLSVGGPGDEAKKLESLKQLATKVAERL